DLTMSLDVFIYLYCTDKSPDLLRRAGDFVFGATRPVLSNTFRTDVLNFVVTLGV
ncbi:MAG: hypothetical protein ACI83D_000513, partial [Planctomycetota bacterium]